jgi:PAS domain S-box-containing protein
VKSARQAWHRVAASGRRAAPLIAVVVLSVAGLVIAIRVVDADRRQATQRRADIATQQVRGGLERARTFAIGLSSAMEGEQAPDARRFASLDGNATATVGLTTALWVEQVPAARRSAYEHRIHRPITTPTGRRAAGRASTYFPATFTTGMPLPAGVDVSGVPALGATLRDPTAVFAGTATPIADFAGRRGFFLVQASHFGRGPGSTGFLVVFVPSGWLSLSVTEDVRRLAISQGGRRLEGTLSTAPDAGESFVDLARPWRVEVARPPATALQNALPWLALAWPVATALLIYLVGRGILRRRRAERAVDDIFDVSLDLLCVADVDGYFRRVNPAFERTLGYTSEELLSRPMLEFIHPDDRDATGRFLASLDTGAQIEHFENRGLLPDGGVRWVQWSARPLPDRGLVYAAGRDVTDNRLLVAEQAALRRVATLVAEGENPAELFEAVAVEVGELLGARATRLLRYEHDGTASVVAGYGAADPAMDVGRRVPAQDLGGRDAAVASIVVSGRPWGVIVATFEPGDAVGADTEARMAKFTELVATAVANAQSTAELTASRRRIVKTADETRERIERDLHDGAQQRLVQTIITLKMAQSRLPDGDGAAAELVSVGLAHAEQAIAEVRELARGIHPAILSDQGLVPALEALGLRSPVPVTLEARANGDLPEPIEITIYYVVSEALANVAKHANATSVHVTLEQGDDAVRLCIGDDGVGGADPTRGSGLIGLKDRVEASGGTLRVESRPGDGTRLLVELPVRAPDPAPSG